jgi:hypothetical protein
MEPKFTRSLHDIITIKNTDEEDFTFEYDRSRGNYPYTIKAGEIKRFPRFLADHAVKHLINKILHKKNIRVDNEAARAAEASEIYIGEEMFQQTPEENVADLTRKTVEELNKPSDLENVIAKAKKNAPPPEKVVDDDFEPKKVEPKTIPTRSELFDYAVKQGLVLDQPDKDGKTLRQKFSKMKIDEVMKELQYE